MRRALLPSWQTGGSIHVRRDAESADREDAARRLRRFLLVNAVGLGSSAVGLGIWWIAVQSRHIAIAAVMLAVASLGLGLGLWAASAGRLAAASLAPVAMGWLTAFGLAYTSPFTLPIGLLSLMAPILVVVEFLPRRIVPWLLGATIVGSGGLSALAETLRDGGEESRPDPPFSAITLLVFVSLVVAVSLLGVVQLLQRQHQQALAIASSRTRLALAADEARRSIERDLHDGAQQHLVTVSVELGRVTRLLEQEGSPTAEELREVHAHLTEAIRELRDLAHGIYPALLGERGLAAALPAAGRRTATPCTVSADGIGRLPAQVEATAYFTCLEAMHNADKHARAGEIRVELWRDDGALRFEVRDDGRGFDSLTAAAAGGKGLTGMADRVRATGGELVVASTPGSGTRVEGRIPLRS